MLFWMVLHKCIRLFFYLYENSRCRKIVIDFTISHSGDLYCRFHYISLCTLKAAFLHRLSYDFLIVQFFGKHTFLIHNKLILIFVIGVQTVSFTDWENIDRFEVKQGENVGKPREKMADVDEMLSVAKKSS